VKLQFPEASPEMASAESISGAAKLSFASLLTGFSETPALPAGSARPEHRQIVPDRAETAREAKRFARKAALEFVDPPTF
jgi:hypothetical protein